MDPGKLIYRYPKVRYKIIDGNPTAIKSELSDVVEFEWAVVWFVYGGSE